MGASLELCSCSRKLCESWLQQLFNKNNYPLVQFHCIIKIMCQDLPLGCLHCLLVCAVQNRNFACNARFYIFYWNVERFWNFLHCIDIQIVYFILMFQNFYSYRSMVNVQIFTHCPVFTDCCYSFIICVCLNTCWSLLDLGT